MYVCVHTMGVDSVVGSGGSSGRGVCSHLRWGFVECMASIDGQRKILQTGLSNLACCAHMGIPHGPHRRRVSGPVATEL